MDKDHARGAARETVTDKDKAADAEEVAEWVAVKVKVAEWVADEGWDSAQIHKTIHGCKPNSATCKPPLKN
jgi:hypothetical protein